MSKGKLEEHGAAIADASESARKWIPALVPYLPVLPLLTFLAKAISLNPRYAKAFYRRGLSYLAILRPTAAVPDFKMALEIEPGNRAIREQLDATRKLIRRIEFEKVGAGRHCDSAARTT
jgi:serine/threonine-protein phosphatase 5